jgi:formylglycine-generating enzyme
MFGKTIVRGLLAVALLTSAVTVRAAAIDMATVPVGNAGNAADYTGRGEVDYNYNIGTYDVTLTQYTTFLNSVATTSDPYGLYNASLGTDLNVAGISRSGGPGAYYYAVIGDGQRPVTYVSWYDAVRFVNWLGTGKTESGAYTITGGSNNGGIVTVPTTAQRAAWAGGNSTVWYLPDLNEWYKAAYNDPTIAGSNEYWVYTTKSNSTPSNLLSTSGTNNGNFFSLGRGYTLGGYPRDPNQNYLTDVGAFTSSPGPYGTFDMGGDVSQWNDLDPDNGSERSDLGGNWNDSVDGLSTADFGVVDSTALGSGGDTVGFRVASSEVVPEPSTMALLGAALLTIAVVNRRNRKPSLAVNLPPEQDRGGKDSQRLATRRIAA